MGDVISSTLQLIGDQGKEAAGLNKLLALANIAIKSAEAIAAATASAAGVPFPGNLFAIATAVGTVLSNIATAKNLLGQAKVPQKKKGGWLGVRGQDDGLLYQAQYIGRPATGMLPDHPVLINSASGSPVLASEEGAEYFVSHRALRNPVVLNYVRAIDNIARSGGVRQFREGGFTEPAGTTSSSPAPPSTGLSPELASTLLRTLNRLSQILEEGVVARYDDDELIRLARRLEVLEGVIG